MTRACRVLDAATAAAAGTTVSATFLPFECNCLSTKFPGYNMLLTESNPCSTTGATYKYTHPSDNTNGISV